MIAKNINQAYCDDQFYDPKGDVSLFADQNVSHQLIESQMSRVESLRNVEEDYIAMNKQSLLDFTKEQIVAGTRDYVEDQ